jgi:hypothetical protein
MSCIQNNITNHINDLKVCQINTGGCSCAMQAHFYGVVPVALILTGLIGYNIYTLCSLKENKNDKRLHKTKVPYPIRAQSPLSVCVLIPVSSRGQNWKHAEDSFVVQMALQNARKTTEVPLYNYTFYVGYDRGDAFFDNASTMADLHRWFADNVGLNSSWVHMRTASISNPLQKPGPIMNTLSQEAYQDGCEYMYRINDDTEFLTQWTSEFIRALQSFSPPNRGVVGPTCHEGNDAILTHDFVHRGHLDLFGTHYPPELTDWWLDDWISSVYGPQSTLKLKNVVVKHHVLSTRYDITWKNKELLTKALQRGQSKVKAMAGG